MWLLMFGAFVGKTWLVNLGFSAVKKKHRCKVDTKNLRNHTLVVISPNGTDSKDLCLLYIAYGFYGSLPKPSSAVTSTDKDVQAAAEIATTAGRHAAVLFNVPAEYLLFPQPEQVPPHYLVEATD